MLTLEAVDHLVFNVRDVEESAQWYETVLGMAREDRRTSTGETRTSVKFGLNKINLRPLSATQDEWFTGTNPNAGSDDVCFLTRSRPDEVVEHFQRNGVEIVQGPVEKSGAQGTICSVYIRDRDGNLIEISSYR